MSDPRLADAAVRLLDRGDPVHVVPALAARAFYPDPLFGFFARDPRHEYHLLASIFDAFVRDVVPSGQIYVAEAGERVLGAALWLPPGAMPRTARRTAAFNARAARILSTGRHRLAGFRLLDAVDKAHPHGPHWYLALLGTDPVVQGRGIGGRLLAPVLERCDHEGLPAYLETQKASNLAFYGRLGFDVTRVIELPGAPTVWTMTRPPR